MIRVLVLSLSLLLLVVSSRAAESVILSEFMADNKTGLRDEDGAFSDWIELQNDGTTTVNLAGWALTDDAQARGKWVFPSVTLAPGQFLVVFASGKNRTVAGSPLHTNFSLSAAGEYLALIKPGGEVATRFVPFPEQFADKSYGIGQNVDVTTLVAADAATRVKVPVDGTLGASWTGAAFDDAGWTTGTQAVGYESSVAGFAVTNHKAVSTVPSLAEAESVITTPAKRSATYVENKGVINYANGNDGHYANNSPFPGFSLTVDVDNFVVEAVGTVTIPAAGNWSFGVSSDDGFALTVGSFTTSYPSPRGPGDTIATFNFPAAGDYPVRLVFYEQGGGAEVELFAVQGAFSSWTAAFKLVGDVANGGLAVRSNPIGTGGYRPLIGTNVATQMLGVNASAYVRIPFTVADKAQLQSLTLKARYDDGFVAYVNGVEIARRNAPSSPTWNSPATAANPNAQAVVAETIDASAALAPLQNGSANVLAVHGMNSAANDADFLQLFELAEYETTGTGAHYFAAATPGQINTSDYFAFCEEPRLSAPRGLYAAAFPVTISTGTPGATIRYTTDGSKPTVSTGTVYTAPFTISATTVLRAAAFKTGFQPSKVHTESFIFPAQTVQQPAQPPGWPATWGPGVTADYQMDPRVVNDPAYSGVIVDALKALPTVSIVMDMNDFLGPSGIYENSTGQGIAWERAASVEWIDPNGGNEFQIDCGIRPQGGASRNPGTSPKHGFRLLFKEIWGPSKLKFKMFSDSAVDEFDTLVLHARFNDAWVWNGASAQYIRDMWCRDTQLSMGRVSPHGNYVHLYVNGIYWGMYDPGEKPDASFAAQHFGGQKSEYDAVNAGEIIDGDATAWNAMFAIARGGLSSNAAYANIQQYLDVPGFIDYMIVNLYAGNTDWPSHNWTAARRRTVGAGYKFFSWDAEWTFSDVNANVTGVSNGTTPGELWQALRANAEFRQLFADHVQRHFFNGGVLTPAQVDARWMRRAAQIDQAIIAESARWGDYRTGAGQPMGRNNAWIPEQQRLRAQFFPQRTQIMVNQFRGIGLFPALSAPVLNQFGGSVDPGFALQITHVNATGAILFTTDGTDPRLAGGAISPSAQTYEGALVLNSHTVIRARVKEGATWSALSEATFYVKQDFAALTISEIMYNPPGVGAVSGDEYEFLEFRNTGANTLDLSGLTFTSGITFTFPGGTSLGGGQFLVLVRNAEKFAERYPGLAIGGVYTGRLDNGGEKIALGHVLGGDVLTMTYGDIAPWPVTPDGHGFSLVPSGLNLGSSGAAATWRASAAVFGSPGASDPAVAFLPVLVNEILSHSVAPQVDTIELLNPNSTAVNIGGWFLTDDASVPRKFVVPAHTVIPAGGFVVFNEAQFNPSPGSATSFSLGADGDQLYLVSGDGVSLTGYSHGFEFGAGAANISFGRYLNSVGEEHFPAQIARSFGAVNTGPRVGPVVISEVMYHPEEGYDEFIELQNVSDTSVPLFDPANPGNTWRVAGLGYALPAGITLPARAFALVVGIDPALFRSKYGVAADVQIVGPYPGLLQDSGERLALQRPDAPKPAGVPQITVDAVRYDDKAPWPTSADGDGPSLQRVNPSAYGDDPGNWFASGLTPGGANVVNMAPTITLLSPANGASIPAVATIVIEAAVNDPDGSISKVEFFQSGTKLGETTAAPWRYSWTNVGAGTYAITAKARDNKQAIAISEPAVVTVTAPPVGNGTGLRGEYYDTNVNLSEPGPLFLTRTDPQVGFDWGGGSPHPSMGADTFTVRWTGQIQPRLSGQYSFYTYSDDGVRLWVNGQQLVNNWTDHGPTEDAGQITLVAGQLYDIRMEFYEAGGGAVAMLSWSATGLSKELVPTSQLYPAGAPTLATQPQSQTVPAGSQVTFSALAAGTAPITYQWSFAGNAITGATGPVLTLNNVQGAHAGSYTVVATNPAGSATSSAAVLTVTNLDRDGDGMPDAWESANGFNPDVAGDGALDADGDGLTNRAEFLAGTDPRNAQSFLRAEVWRDAGGNMVVRFGAASGKAYTAQWRAALGTPGGWTKLADVAAGAARTVDVPDPAATTRESRIYRVVTPQQP